MYPIVEGYKGAVSPGYFFHFEDPLQFNQINASLSVSPFDNMRTRDRLPRQAAATRRSTGTFSTSTTAPTSTTCSGRSSAAAAATCSASAYNKTIIYDPPRQLDLFGSAAIYLGLERLPSAQNIASPKNIVSLEAGAKYTNTRKALGGVDHEKGIAWRALADLDYARRRGLSRSSTAGSIMACRCRSRTARLWIYAHARHRLGRSREPARRFLFRLVPQQLRR